MSKNKIRDEYLAIVEIEGIKKERDEAIELLKETRKFLNRLPSDWYPENIAATIDATLMNERI